MELAKTLQQLETIGVSFLVTHDAPSGGRSVPLGAVDVAKYSADPVKFLARHYGVTPTEYLGWHQSNFSVKCSANTVKGHRCKSTIPGGTFIEDPKVWAEMQGSYCSTHGGGS